jgi:1,2-phenylacetyl-CoA epoxidase PaaB subunit
MVQVKIEGPLMPRYRVDIRGKELQQLGTVDAPNAWEALAKAVEQFDIRPALRSKTVVTKLEDPKPSSLL